MIVFLLIAQAVISGCSVDSMLHPAVQEDTFIQYQECTGWIICNLGTNTSEREYSKSKYMPINEWRECSRYVEIEDYKLLPDTLFVPCIIWEHRGKKFFIQVQLLEEK